MSTIQISDSALNKSIHDKIGIVADVATKLNLSGHIEIVHDLHKAHAGERISTEHVNPYIWQLEKQFYELFDPESVVKEVLSDVGLPAPMIKAIQKPKIYGKDSKPLTEEQMEQLDRVVSKALMIPENKVREILLKSALVGKLSGSTLMGKPIKIDISKLPIKIQQAIKLYNLTQNEINAIKFALNYAAVNVTGVTERTRALIKRSILDGLSQRMSRKTIANKMYNDLAVGDSAVLNRDWERLAVTEVNYASNNGFIAGQPAGSFVVGNSHKDACPYCMKYINNKIYRVTDDPPPEYSNLNPNSKAYKEITNRWDTEVWVGKNNYNRSLSARKRVDGKLVPRNHYELVTPTLPLHPHCRCTFSTWIPDLYYLKDKSGEVHYAIDEKSRKEHAIFVKNHPLLSKYYTGGIA